MKPDKPVKQSKQSKPKKGLGTPELSWDMAIDWSDIPELGGEPLSLEWELPDLSWEIELDPWGDLPEPDNNNREEDGKKLQE